MKKQSKTTTKLTVNNKKKLILKDNAIGFDLSDIGKSGKIIVNNDEIILKDNSVGFNLSNIGKSKKKDTAENKIEADTKIFIDNDEMIVKNNSIGFDFSRKKNNEDTRSRKEATEEDHVGKVTITNKKIIADGNSVCFRF